MTAQDPLYLDLMKKCLTGWIYDESAWSLVGPEDVPKLDARAPLRSRCALAKRWILGAFRRRSLGIVRRRPFAPQERAEGRGDWPLVGYSMVGLHRLANVQACIEDVLNNGVPGDLIEAGVWRGGTAIFMRAVLKYYGASGRTVWAADSFEGLPPPKSPEDGWDLSGKSYLRVSLEQVQANFRRFGLLDDQVRFLRGWFSETLPRAPIERLALLRLDGDLYHSTRDTLEALYDRVSPGGYVIVDDYHSWPSCRRAVTDFLADRRLRVALRPVDWSGVYWQVPAGSPREE